VLSTSYRIHTNYANFQKVVERTAGYDINQQTLVEENILILNNILFWSTLFLMHISQQQRKNILY